MPQFDFHLDGVLHHRKNTEREKQRLLAVVLGQMSELQGRLQALDAEVQATTEDVRKHHLTGKIDLDFLAAHRRYLAATEKQAMAIVQKMSVVQRAVDEARGALAAVARDRKVLEKLRERQKDAWQAEIDRRELAAQDEASMQMSYRAESHFESEAREAHPDGE